MKRFVCNFLIKLGSCFSPLHKIKNGGGIFSIKFIQDIFPDSLTCRTKTCFHVNLQFI